MTCHNPHRDAEVTPSYYEGKCLSCHDADASRATLAHDLPETSRRVPCPVSPKQGCIGCHMPSSEGEMRHSTFADHAIRVHRDTPGR